MSNDLKQVGRMIKENKTYEQRVGYNRLIVHSRLPMVIKCRKGLMVYTYKLEFGDVDDRVYLSYSDKDKSWKAKGKVLMHYEESTLRDCISKAWRNLAENGIDVKVEG